MDEESKVKLMTGTIKHLRAEITQLRADLAAERELADRLAGRLDHMGDCFWDISCDEALSDWRTRRSK